MLDLNALREEIRHERGRHEARLGELERKVENAVWEQQAISDQINGTNRHKHQGLTDRLVKMEDYVETIKSIDFKEMKANATQIKDFLKHGGWAVGTLGGAIGALWLIAINLDKIQKLFHP